MQHFTHKLGRFLQILFGCHARPERSFFFRGKQFPICARCTGELIGILAGIPTAIIFGFPKLPYVFLMMVPLLVDGFLQLLTSYESGNLRRLFTGILFGLAFDFTLIYIHRGCIHIAGWILKQFWDDPTKIDRAMEMFL